MKKIKDFLNNFGKVDLEKAENQILSTLTEFEGQKLTVEQKIKLFNSVKSKFDNIILEDRIEAERDAQLCAYFQGEFKKAPTYQKASEKITVNLN